VTSLLAEADLRSQLAHRARYLRRPVAMQAFDPFHCDPVPAFLGKRTGLIWFPVAVMTYVLLRRLPGVLDWGKIW
jgi:hypothetical protein